MKEKVQLNQEASVDAGLRRLLDDYLTQKQNSLMQLRKGNLGKVEFLREAAEHLHRFDPQTKETERQIMEAFEQYIFGYSRLSVLMDDPTISDIRVISYDNIRIKRMGKRMDAGIAFASEKEYRQFIDYIATKNQVNI